MSNSLKALNKKSLNKSKSPSNQYSIKLKSTDNEEEQKKTSQQNNKKN